MTEATVCGRCGAPSMVGAQFCYACGQSLAPAGPTVAPAIANPPVPAAPPASTPPAAPAPPAWFPPATPAPAWAATVLTPPAPQATAQAPYQPPPYQPPPYPQATYPQSGYQQPPAPAWSVPAPAAPSWFGAGSAGQPGPYGAPPAGYYAGNPSTTGSPMPFGIVALTVTEIVIAIVGFLVVRDLLYWTGFRGDYEDFGWATVDLLLGLVYLATSAAGLIVARGLYLMRPWAWLPACALSLVLIGLDIFSIVVWGLTVLDAVGIAVHLAVLGYLNLNPVRAIFGRPPTSLLQFTA